MTGPIIAIDAGTSRDREADHLIALLGQRWSLAQEVSAATHLERDGGARVIVTVELDDASASRSAASAAADVAAILGDGRSDDGAATVAVFARSVAGDADRVDWVGSPTGLPAVERAVARHRQRAGGRLVTFPGSDGLHGVLSVITVIERTAIDRVAPVGGVPVNGDSLVDTRSFVRPHWRGGELVLDIVAMAGGFLAPFEVPNPTPCCADHA